MSSRWVIVVTGAVMSAALIAGQALNLWFAAALRDLPSTENVRLDLTQSIRILDRTGGELYRVTQDQDRTSLAPEQIPEIFRHAIVDIEDERFFERGGCIDIQGILRAAWRNLISGEPSEGGSTITQQLVRSLYLQPDKTLARKVREIAIACRLEGTLSKEDILTLYVNRVAFGNRAYGLEQAAQTYFGVQASDLTLAQAAVLAALPQRPSYFDPYGQHLRTAIEAETQDALQAGTMQADDVPREKLAIGLLPRRVRAGSGEVLLEGRAGLVLAAMLRNGHITAAEESAARSAVESMAFVPPKRIALEAPHFVFWVREQLDALMAEEDRGREWAAAGLRVATTLDPELQALAEKTVSEARERLRDVFQARNIALIALDRRTREVLAYVGNADYFAEDDEGSIDMARAPRQPGSSFKPLVYAALFANSKYTPKSFIADLPLRIGSAKPKNYEGGYLGWMTVRKALALSRNIPAIRAFFLAGGEQAVLQMAAAAGASTPLVRAEKMKTDDPDFAYGWPLSIGAAETPLLEMTNAYATIANGGLAAEPVSIHSIKDNAGIQRLATIAPPPVQAIPATAAANVDSILRDASMRPEGYWRDALTLPGGKNAAKTGTSNLCFKRSVLGNCTDYGVNNVWTLGYTDDLVVGVWVGNADNQPMIPEADGLNAAAPVWKAFMGAARNVN